MALVFPRVKPLGTSSVSSRKAIGNTASFPTEAMDYLKIDIFDSRKTSPYNYVGSGAGTGRTKGKSKESIFLYLPANLSEQYTTKYNQVGLGAAGIAGTQMFQQGNTQDAGTMIAQAAEQGKTQIAGNVAASAMNIANMGNSNITANDLAALAKRAIMNPYEETTFQGVDYRTHSFQFKLVPRSPQDVVAITKIIQSLRVSMLPGVSGGGDAGGAIGAALASWDIHLSNNRVIEEKKDGMKGCYFGPNFTDVEIESELNACGAKFEKVSRNNLIQKIASEISNNKIIGWMQGKMEFGPRALGNRSILADPRSSEMQRQLNLKIKFRESFRPFAPSILIEDLSDWFEFDAISPYMLFVSDLKQDKRIKSYDDDKKIGLDKLAVVRSQVPAVTHVDYSARIQTVDKSINSIFYQLIAEFKKITGCPMLINTSFNVRGEPIVNTPTDAFKCFMGTELDYLIIGNCFLDKKKQPEKLKIDYRDKFKLD